MNSVNARTRVTNCPGLLRTEEVFPGIQDSVLKPKFLGPSEAVDHPNPALIRFLCNPPTVPSMGMGVNLLMEVFEGEFDLLVTRLWVPHKLCGPKGHPESGPTLANPQFLPTVKKPPKGLSFGSCASPETLPLLACNLTSWQSSFFIC